MTILFLLKPHPTTYLRRQLDDGPEPDARRKRKKTYDIREKNRKRVAIEVKKSVSAQMLESSVSAIRRDEDAAKRKRIRRANEMLLRLLMEDDML